MITSLDNFFILKIYVVKNFVFILLNEICICSFIFEYIKVIIKI